MEYFKVKTINIKKLNKTAYQEILEDFNCEKINFITLVKEKDYFKSNKEKNPLLCFPQTILHYPYKGFY